MASLLQTGTQIPSSALKRINRDMRVIYNDPVSYQCLSAEQDPDNGYIIHANLFNETFGNIHVKLICCEDFPNTPPEVTIFGQINNHPNIFYHDMYGPISEAGSYVCLDILKKRDYSSPKDGGWTSAYHLGAFLMQLNTLFEENIEQDYGGYATYDPTRGDIRTYKNSLNGFRCTCGHTFSNPFPPMNKVAFTLKNYNFPQLEGTSNLTDEKCNDSITSIVNTEDLPVNNIYFNKDIIEYILMFLPIVYIKKCKKVCKHWEKWLTDSVFL